MSSSTQQPAYAPIGGEFDQGRPLGVPLHRQRDGRGVVPQSQRRREWWWQPGPVDSFLCCFSLSCAVVFLAAYATVVGTLAISANLWMVTAGLPALHDQYASECGGDAAKLAKCTTLAEAIENLTAAVDVVLLLPTLLVWAVDVVSGAIGLWAVLYSNARAAKLFLRSQALVYLMNRVYVAIHAFAVPHPSTSGFWAGFAFSYLFHVVVALYQLKVLWSYHMLLLKRSRRSQASPSLGTAAEVGMTELDGSPQVV